MEQQSHGVVFGGSSRACACGRTFASARGVLLHQHAVRRARRCKHENQWSVYEIDGVAVTGDAESDLDRAEYVTRCVDCGRVTERS